ncbi:MAG: hypothetical protein GY859_29685 [Desulfobacterales bacterium]|nr:hypothetical protein [Desulfobacterales bacterium]
MARQNMRTGAWGEDRGKDFIRVRAGSQSPAFMGSRASFTGAASRFSGVVSSSSSMALHAPPSMTIRPARIRSPPGEMSW